jgi:hypothetical protein
MARSVCMPTRLAPRHSGRALRGTTNTRIMINIVRSLVEGTILLVFCLLYLGFHGGYRVLLQASPAAWAIIAGLVLVAGLQKIIPALLRRIRHQPEPPQAVSAAEWRLIVLILLLSCSLWLVFDNMWFFSLLMMPSLFRLCRCFPSPKPKS